MTCKYTKSNSIKLEELSSDFAQEMFKSFCKYEVQQVANLDLRITPEDEKDFICSYLCF